MGSHRINRGDYRSVRPLRHSLDGMTRDTKALHPKPAVNSPKNTLKSPPPDYTTLSIRINLPDYEKWRATIFARQYPYLSIGIAVAGVLGLSVLGIALSNL